MAWALAAEWVLAAGVGNEKREGRLEGLPSLFTLMPSLFRGDREMPGDGLPIREPIIALPLI
jgi:hypothetical protein